MMCLRRDWGSNISTIALKLLKKGIPFKTLQPMAVSPRTRRPLSELRTYSLRYFRPPFKAVYTDYIVYEQYHHEFMKEDCAQAALLRGGILWRLALHSLGSNVLPSALIGISQDAVPFGQMLSLNCKTHFDDDLSEEEVDFICGTYYVYTNNGCIEKLSWWPRPRAWAGSGLDVGFWSARCEGWFQTRLENIRQVNNTRLKHGLKFNGATKKFKKNLDVACSDFLTMKASAFTDN
ncbi:hypothetical protein DFJ58DRAFT_735124 [Suillus subalutaceus]|uniref:uncharacterized protein n=1 Tax=Suillus subalutaceus TaxID=48586 RepID=UPI001B868D11|nr:uncharacterized protein DFJ58DRAFT_735124 [Suillus subalutaceus]KAG1836197.1 hypothetical protein DFJ58DRAFT_735124 [Suillus subalutaceus]